MYKCTPPGSALKKRPGKRGADKAELSGPTGTLALNHRIAGDCLAGALLSKNCRAGYARGLLCFALFFFSPFSFCEHVKPKTNDAHVKGQRLS